MVQSSSNVFFRADGRQNKKLTKNYHSISNKRDLQVSGSRIFTVILLMGFLQAFATIVAPINQEAESCGRHVHGQSGEDYRRVGVACGIRHKATLVTTSGKRKHIEVLCTG